MKCVLNFGRRSNKYFFPNTLSCFKYSKAGDNKTGQQVKEDQKTKSKEDEKLNKVDEKPKYIIIEKYDAVTTINLNRPSCRNSLNVETLNELTKAIDDFDKDTTSKVLVLNGESGVFCSGFNMHEVHERGYTTLTDAAKRLSRLPLCDKPTIAAVAGYAVAEGFELALACDIRVVEDTACMGFLGRRFGLTTNAMDGTARLAMLIGISRALELSMTGKMITGVSAETYGITNKLTCTGTGEATKLAKALAKFPQNALITDKLQAINRYLDPSNLERVRNEAVIASHTGDVEADIKLGVELFKKGIGRHGKASNLTEMPKKDWEIEEDKLRLKFKKER